MLTNDLHSAWLDDAVARPPAAGYGLRHGTRGGACPARRMEGISTALGGVRLELDCQPIMPSGGDTPASHELLVRLRRGDGQRVLPGLFLDQAGEAGLLPALDRWVIAQAVEWLRANPASGAPRHTLSVNVSADTLAEDGFSAYVLRWLGRAGVAPGRLTMELTEWSAIDDLPAATCVLRDLRAAGISVALDDFGTGFNSLDRLSSLPVDSLKVDGLFVQGMLERPVDAAIVRSIIELGHALGIAVVAEYVESPEQIERLTAAGVDYLQGYAFGQPVPIEELA